tara:strand:- start:399 stop:623 length:225 start_codon:yes stop_codon:yes gene_type:complete
MRLADAISENMKLRQASGMEGGAEEPHRNGSMSDQIIPTKTHMALKPIHLTANLDFYLLSLSRCLYELLYQLAP